MNKLKCYTIWGIIFVLIIGTLMHFTYEWSGSNPIVGLFSPVNESIWEHMKLVFFPTFLYSLFMNKQLRNEYPCVASSLCFGILLGTLLIPIIFYTYTGILGYNLLILDIGTFAISVIISFFAIYKFTLSCYLEEAAIILSIIVFAFMLCFIVFTYAPPQVGIFTA